MIKRLITILLCFFMIFSISIDAYAFEETNQKESQAIYYILIDRFHNGTGKNDYETDVKNMNAFFGGDFIGISEKLDYIKEMGFSIINLSPIFNNDQNGYDGHSVIDFESVEEHYGTLDEFRSLVKEAHKKGLKVIVDLDFFYTSKNHPWLKDLSKQDWYLETNEEKAKLNINNPYVQQYFIEIASKWMKETGIDGFRFVHLHQIPTTYLSNFIEEIRQVNTNAIFTGEIMDSKDLEQYKEFGLTFIGDISFMENLRESFSAFDHSLKEINEFIQNSLHQQELIKMFDHEQSSRFTFDMVNHNMNPGTRWKLALTYLFTTPGYPFVMYGSEIALNGDLPPNNHQFMNFRTEKELIDLLKKLKELRNQYPSLTYGDFDVLYDDQHAAIYKRVYNDETMIVAINNGSKTLHVEIDEDKIAKGQELKGVLNGDLIREANHKYSFFIDREQSEIYLLKEKSGINISFLIAIIAVNVIFITFMYIVWKRGKKKAE